MKIRQWLSRNVWAVSGFGQNVRDPMKNQHVKEREMKKTAHFACIQSSSDRLHFLLDIVYWLSDLKLRCDGLRLNGKLQLNEMVGLGFICMRE